MGLSVRYRNQVNVLPKDRTVFNLKFKNSPKTVERGKGTMNSSPQRGKYFFPEGDIVYHLNTYNYVCLYVSTVKNVNLPTCFVLDPSILLNPIAAKLHKLACANKYVQLFNFLASPRHNT